MGTELRALIVEDSPEDAELLERELRRGEFIATCRRVDEASELRAALEEHQWDIVLSDYSMPRFDGLSAFRVVRAHDPDIPFIIVSGTVGEDVAVRAMHEGVQDYLLKDNLARLNVAIRRELKETATRRKRREAETALSRSEAYVMALLRAVPDAIFRVRRDGTCLDQLSGPTAAAGVEAEGVVGRTVEEVFGAAGPTLLGAVEEAFAARTLQTLDYKLEVEDGYREYEARATTCSDHEALVIVRDVTEQRRLGRRTQGAQRMEAVGRLAGGIAHDFNNVLSVIQTYAEFCRDEDNERRDEDLDTIVAAAKRAGSLVSQLLAFSRRQVQALASLDLNQIVAETERLLERTLGENIELSTSLPDGLWEVRADRSQVEQIVMNLAINARDAMPTGGRITIETNNVNIEHTYGLAKGVEIEPGDYVMLALSDTGIGMDESTQAQIFEPFFTTKEPHRGTGLGLSTVYGIVKQSGGYVWVYSEPGSGSTFKIYLPRALGKVGDKVLRRPTATRSTAGTETVLLVEDDDAVREATRRILARCGYQVLPAANAKQGIAAARQHTGPIDLLLTDVVMPGESGVVLSQKVMRLHPGIRVIFMSGYTDNAIVHNGVLDEGVDFLQKPLTRESLQRTVREVLDRNP